MSYTEDLKKILENQRELLTALETAIGTVEQEVLAAENALLKEQVQSLSKHNNFLVQRVSDMSEESNRLKASLNEQMLKERIGLLKYTRRNLDFYYNDTTGELLNRITQLESKYKTLLDTLKKSIESLIAESDTDLSIRFAELEKHFNTVLKDIRTQHIKGAEALKNAAEKEIREREGDPLPSAEALEKRLRVFNIEMGIGTKAANVLGLLLILLGVVFGLQYTYVHILHSDELRGAAAYVLGILFLIAGEVLQRRRSTIFSMGLAAGGVAILFAATAMSYFVLGILSIPAAIALCVGISAVAFLLSVRYSSQTIACFALLGGYLPMTALSPDDTGMVVGAMGYFVFLTLLALVLASQKKWLIMNILSFVLSSIGALVLTLIFNAPVLAGVVYLSANFIMYLGLILIYPVRMVLHNKRKDLERSDVSAASASKSADIPEASLTIADVVMLSANTIINCVMIYSVLNRDDAFPYNGLLAIGFFAVYFAGAKLTERFLSNDRRVSGLFYITALIFAILIMPLQFSLDWLMIGWMAMGVALVVYGVLQKLRGFEWAGWLITALGILAFITNIMGQPWMSLWHFVNYTCLTLGLVGILAAYRAANRHNALFFHSQKGRGVLIFQYMLIIQTLFYSLYTASFLHDLFEGPWQWHSVLLVMTALVYGIVIKYIPWINDRGSDRIVSAISLCISVWAVLAALILNTSAIISFYRPIADLGLLLVFNLFSVFVVFDGVNTIRKLWGNIVEGLSLATSVYGLVLVTLVLMVQYEYSVTSMVLSAIGMLAAFLWITFGFVRRNRTMRLFGLVFSIFSLAKLFFVDLYFLPAGMRIVSYFIFGIIFLAISFVYQFFSRRLRDDVE